MSAASWLLIAALTNIDGNVMPILFDYQQYFLSCALFGLGLGFFQEPKLSTALGLDSSEARSEHQAENEDQDQEDDDEAKDSSAATDAGAVAGKDMASAPDEKKIGISWAIWLTVVMVVLLWVISANLPGGLPNAMSISLQDESADVFISEFDNGRMTADIISVGLFSVLLFAWLQIFVASGNALKRLYAGVSGVKALAVFAAGGVLAWSVAAGVSLLPSPPAILLTIACSVLLALSQKRASIAAWCAAAIAICIFLNSNGPKSDTSSANQYKNNAETLWINGSRIDARPILSGDKILALAVWSDRSLYDLLPANISAPEEAKNVQKQCGLPELPENCQDLLYRAMPDMKGKQALILGAGLGADIETGLNHGLVQVTAVEPRRWLTDLSSKQSFSPYLNKAVTLATEAPRQFMRGTKEQYDLILYSHHKAVNRPNPFIAINHDDYLYTVEALYDSLSHLKDDGQLVITTPPGNDLVRVRMAANALALNGLINAELTTPYANYIVVAKTAQETGPGADIVGALRQKVGSKIVNRQALLIKKAGPASLTRDDRPFVPGWGPMIPLADCFLAILTMLAMLCSVRLHVPQSMLQNVSKARCRAFLLGVMVTMLGGGGCLIIAMEYGSTPQSIYGSVIGFWLMQFLAAALIARQSLPPTWVLRVAFGLVLAVDLCFNYGAAAWLPNPLIKFVACAIFPLVPAALAGGLLSREITAGEKETLGLGLMGFAVGCLLGLSAMFVGRVGLDLLAAGLALTVLLLTFPAKKAEIPLN